MKSFAILFLAFGMLQAQGQEVVLSDFKTVPPAVYGTWLDAQTGKSNLRIITPGQLEVTPPATAKGGTCGKDLNLSLDTGSVLELTAVVKPGNLANGVNILLEDANGVQAGWSLRISDLQPDKKSVLISAPLQSPDFVNAKGDNSQIDLTRIVGWHVQGDFTSDDQIHLVFERLVVRPKSL